MEKISVLVYKWKTDAKELKKEINNKMDTNANKMEEMRGEMQQMGRGLQAGIEAILCDETRTAGEIMATPRVGTNELGLSATAVRPAVAAGEDRVIRETCWARSAKVTETVTQGEKLIGVTETCTRERKEQYNGRNAG